MVTQEIERVQIHPAIMMSPMKCPNCEKPFKTKGRFFSHKQKCIPKVKLGTKSLSDISVSLREKSLNLAEIFDELSKGLSALKKLEEALNEADSLRIQLDSLKDAKERLERRIISSSVATNGEDRLQ